MINTPKEHEHGQDLPQVYHHQSACTHLIIISRESLCRAFLIARIKSQILFARLNEDFFHLLHVSESRDALRRVLVETYFAPEVRPIIVEVSRITTSSFEYSRDLLNRSRGRFTLQEASSVEEVYVAEVRSTAFRRVVVEAYHHTCAVCRIRTK